MVRVSVKNLIVECAATMRKQNACEFAVNAAIV